MGGGEHSTLLYKPSTSVRLLLSALAGVLNVTLTFPLDVLAARSQTAVDSKSTNHDTSTCTRISHSCTTRSAGTNNKSQTVKG